MAQIERDETREERIHMEIVVDAYGPEERAMGWYAYLEDILYFPFLARCTAKRAISPLQAGDEVEVLGLAPEGECEYEIFVMIRWDRPEGLGVPLSQLKVVHAEDEGETSEAVEDWLYWAGRGYEF
jgi:hypothetical protein